MLSNIIILLIIILIIILSIFVVNVKNTIESIMYLILIFVLNTLLILILGAEFIAVVLFVVYVGAISILFLYVVMMLNLRIVQVYSTSLNYLPISILLGCMLLFMLLCLFISDNNSFLGIYLKYNNESYIQEIYSMSNIELIGQLLFNYNALFIIIVGLLLLVAMIGSIVLIMDFNKDTKINTKKNNIIWIK